MVAVLGYPPSSARPPARGSEMCIRDRYTTSGSASVLGEASWAGTLVPTLEQGLNENKGIHIYKLHIYTVHIYTCRVWEGAQEPPEKVTQELEVGVV